MAQSVGIGVTCHPLQLLCQHLDDLDRVDGLVRGVVGERERYVQVGSGDGEPVARRPVQRQPGANVIIFKYILKKHFSWAYAVMFIYLLMQFLRAKCLFLPYQ
jgi:hypothetical protein